MTKIRKSKWLTLGFPMVLLVIAVVVIIIALTKSIDTRRFEIQSKQTLLEIQRALQNYHVAEEIYPSRTPMSGEEIVQFLISSGHLEDPPLNPWTGDPYQVDAPDQIDGITYRTDELAETYALEATDKNLTPNAPLWQLDSTEHHSLE